MTDLQQEDLVSRGHLAEISQLEDLDAQARALRVQFEAMITRAMQDGDLNARLMDFADTLHADSRPDLALLVTALGKVQPYSIGFVERMAERSLSSVEKNEIRAARRMWAIAHGEPVPSRFFDTPEHTRITLQTIAAAVATVALVALMLVLHR